MSVIFMRGFVMFGGVFLGLSKMESRGPHCRGGLAALARQSPEALEGPVSWDRTLGLCGLSSATPHTVKHPTSLTRRGVGGSVLLVVGVLPDVPKGARRETAAGLVAAVNDYLVRAKALTF